MKILALDTSGPSHSVALLEEDRWMAGRDLMEVSAHTEILLPTIESLLEELNCSLPDLDLLSLTIGPGSFTGLRIGMSAVKAMAWARSLPVVGVDTLTALAAPHWREGLKVLSCLDARRGEVYASLSRGSAEGDYETLWEPRLWAWQTLQEALSAEAGPLLGVGSGVQAHPQLLAGPDREGPHPDPKQHRVQARWVGRLAWRAMQRGQTTSAAQLRPLYLRVSHAEAMRLQN